jgi:hypothetical protein
VVYLEDGIPSAAPSIGLGSFYRTTPGSPPYDRRGSPDIADIPHGSTYFRAENDGFRDDTDICHPAESVLAQGGTSIVDSVTGSETMTIAMNKMVDSLVGPREDPSSEDEEILFLGRRRRKATRNDSSRPKLDVDFQGSQIVPSESESTPKRTVPEIVAEADREHIIPQVSKLYTAKDLATIVQNFTSTQHPIPSLPSPSRGPLISLMSTPFSNEPTISPVVWMRHPGDHVVSPLPSATSIQNTSSFFHPDNIDESESHKRPSPYLPHGELPAVWDGQQHHL